MTVYPDDGYELDQAIGFTPGEELVITSDMTLSATFKKKTYTVTVIAEHGTVSAKDDLNNVVDLTQPIEHGTHIWLTATPEDDTYYLWRWEGYTEKDGLTVMEDITVTAVFLQYSSYHVVFVDYDDTILKEENVLYGKAATAPVDPTREGYKFIGWDKDFSSVTEDMTVKALYEQMEESIKNIFSFDNAAKVVRNGQIYILRGDKTYTVTGQEVR